MANKVAGDLYESVTGQLFEIGRQLRQPNGYPFDPFMLQVHLQAAIEGRFSVIIGNFRYDKRKDGWKLLENVPRRLTSVNIEAVSFLKEKETRIKGEKMARRAQELKCDYSQEDAEYLLEHQNEIPKELREFYFVFPGTIWEPSVGRRGVPCLFWCDGQWILDFSWFDCYWISDVQLVRLRK